MTKRLVWLVVGGALLVSLVAVMPSSWLVGAYNRTVGHFFRHTVKSRLAQFGDMAAKRLEVSELPEKIDIVALKKEKRLELWGADASGRVFWIKSYPILAASGTMGTKLAEGDLQVPEGIYAIESLHPNSFFYLALKIDYPSADDKKMALAEKRDVDKLGTAIMLHGQGGSVGCISVANDAMEEIFYLVAQVGVENTRILICPYDFRRTPPPASTRPSWLSERYQQLDAALKSKPLPSDMG